MNYIYSSAKHRRSGTTMQKKPSRGQGWDHGPRPGFPAKPFKVEADARAYGQGSTMACLICGKETRKVLAHVRAQHKIDGADYRIKFNIPYDVKLIDPKLTQAARERGLRLENVEMIRKFGQRKERGERSQRQPCAFAKAKAISNMRGIQGNLHMGGPPIKYTDFSWHVEQAGKTHAYTKITPPKGHAAWKTFKDRRNDDPALNAQFYAARASRQRKIA